MVKYICYFFVEVCNVCGYINYEDNYFCFFDSDLYLRVDSCFKNIFRMFYEIVGIDYCEGFFILVVGVVLLIVCDVIDIINNGLLFFD